MNGNSKPHTVNSSRILRSRVRRQTSTSHFVSAQSYAKDVYVCIWIFVIHQIFLLFMLSPVYNSLNFCTYISRGFLYSCFELAVEFLRDKIFAHKYVTIEFRFKASQRNTEQVTGINGITCLQVLFTFRNIFLCLSCFEFFAFSIFSVETYDRVL